MSAPEPLLKPTDVAKWLGKSKSWVYAAAERGLITSTTMGRDLRFERADVQKYIDSQKRKPTPAPALVKEEG